jgi:hypothetical protein
MGELFLLPAGYLLTDTWTESERSREQKRPGPIQVYLRPPFDMVVTNCRRKSYASDGKNII